LLPGAVMVPEVNSDTPWQPVDNPPVLRNPSVCDYKGCARRHFFAALIPGGALNQQVWHAGRLPLF